MIDILKNHIDEHNAKAFEINTKVHQVLQRVINYLKNTERYTTEHLKEIEQAFLDNLSGG